MLAADGAGWKRLRKGILPRDGGSRDQVSNRNARRISMSFARFMSGPMGRLLRIAAGLALIAYGLVAMTGAGGAVLAVVGAPLFGGPFLGSKVLAQH
jgi:hypothetical protein